MKPGAVVAKARPRIKTKTKDKDRGKGFSALNQETTAEGGDGGDGETCAAMDSSQ